VFKGIRQYGHAVAFLLALAATVGSLYTSGLLGWEPCTLCDLQRALMFPLVPILGWSLYTGRSVGRWVVTLPVLGAITSGYRHLLVRFDPTRSCGFGLPCSADYGFYIGSYNLAPMYLPLLAFVAFVLIATFVDFAE